MKLSEFNTDQLCDLLCSVTPYVMDILKDEELLEELVRTFSDGKKEHSLSELVELGASKISAIVQILLQKKRSSIYGILSVLNGKTVEEIKKQKGYITVRQLVNVFNDKELIDFFKSCVSMEGSK